MPVHAVAAEGDASQPATDSVDIEPMLIEHRCVRVLGVAVLLLVVSCTVPNPRSCADGLCTDQRYPYCDVDGALEGSPLSCISVACNPGEFKMCRGDLAITCNSTGNDYDLIECELGCDAVVGCRMCASNDQCANPSPVCDAMTSSCRACALDDECASTVCEGGACVAESGIVYAAPTGSNTSNCSLAEPCTISRAQQVAISVAIPPIIRLLPGVYAAEINIGTPTNAPVRIVGSGATVSATTPVQVNDGANVLIRGVAATGTNGVVTCNSATTTKSTLTLENVDLYSTGGLVGIGTCDVTITASDLFVGSSNGTSSAIAFLFGGNYGSVRADRIHVHGNSTSGINAFSGSITVGITNSVLENVSFQWTAPGSIFMSFNTILAPSGLDCRTNSTSPMRTSIYENNIVVATASAVNGPECTLGHNVLFPYPSAPGTNIVADPQFVDATAKNYHLQPTSPAIDAAVTTPTSPATSDFENTKRSQGAAPDIGAFEFLF